jgi:alkanesulfonate monooxygenase
MKPSRALRFHWSLSQAGQMYRRAGSTTAMTGLPPIEAQLELCRQAEASGIESVLMAIGFTRPDPLVLSAVLGMQTDTLKFMVACRAGLVVPTLFVQQINTLSSLIGGRVHVNMVAGHTPHALGYYGDFLDHDAAGASQFLFMGWPDIEEMAIFGAEVLPLVRELEACEVADVALGGRVP